ncbi:MAG: fimbrial protein [Paenalcaligenes sp.]
MKHLLKVFFLILTLVFAKESMALSCTLQNGTLAIEEPISSKISIPPLAPINTVVWRSKTYNLDVKCWHENPATSLDDYIYIFLGTQGLLAGNILEIGDKLQPGIRIDGQDFLCSQLSAQGGCGINTWQTLQKCSNILDCQNKSKTFSGSFSTFLAVKKQGNPNQTGYVVSTPVAPIYPMAQFRGYMSGITPTSTNFALYVSRLENLQYIGCSSTVDIQPRRIDFKRVGSSSAQADKTIEELPFTITANKSCTTPYGLGGSFVPLDGTLTQSNTTLIPSNNNSVGIQIIDKNSKQKLAFKQEFLIAPMGNMIQTVHKELTARLVWVKNTATVGPFNATARLDVYYK